MRRPRITDDHPWLRYVYTTVAGLLITFSICLWKGVFRETDTALIVRYLSDAFLIPGVLLMTGIPGKLWHWIEDSWLADVICFVLFWVCVYFICTASQDPFMYF